MSAQQAITLYGRFDQYGIRCWIMGGWGVHGASHSAASRTRDPTLGRSPTMPATGRSLTMPTTGRSPTKPG
jgi:hypothetical protein